MAPRFTAAQGIAFGIAAVFLFAYPWVAAQALDAVTPRWVALIWLGVSALILVVRRRIEARTWGSLLLLAAPGMALLGVAAVFDDALPLRAIPALVNLTLAFLFVRSLGEGGSIVEEGARLIQPNLPDFTRPYCRKSTALWALFFGVCTLVIGWLAVADPAAWAIFTTRTYLMALLVLSIIEFFVRKIHFRNYESGPVDALLAVIFPAENTSAGRRSTAYLERMREHGLTRD